MSDAPDVSKFTGRKAAIRDCTANLPLEGPHGLHAYHDRWRIPRCPETVERKPAPVGSQKPAPPPPEKPAPSHGLGDAVSAALSMVGITEERVSAWLGRPCHCSERRAKLNSLGEWAARLLRGESAEPPDMA